ncbi:hypothetical protein BH11ACT6_BH11ACT6_37630 [soil metagenome]
MSRLSQQARRVYHVEMASAASADTAQTRWRHLERAHIVSQPDPWLHTRNHVAMFALAVHQRDRREALGQVLRIVVAAPGSLAGKYPEGNTGRTSAGLTTPMSLPPDLAEVLAGGTTDN